MLNCNYYSVGAFDKQQTLNYLIIEKKERIYVTKNVKKITTKIENKSLLNVCSQNIKLFVT